MPKRDIDWSDFKGVPRLPKPNFTMVPDILFDLYLPALSDAELRVLLYIIRHTLGWKKDSDSISLRQLTDGMQKRDGTWQDFGCGLTRRGVINAIKGTKATKGTKTTKARKAILGLEVKGLICVTRVEGPNGDASVNVYRLRYDDEG